MIFGLEQTKFIDEMNLQLDIPAVTALKFMNDEVDVALLPTGVLPQLHNYKIITDVCIGAINKVKTVAIFSEKKLEEVENIYLDYQSRTSVELLKILLKEYWQMPHIKLLAATESVESKIKNGDAALLIGDKTFPLFHKIPFQYDLATAWNKLTNLPFAFAVWVAKPHVASDWQHQFNAALKVGIEKRNDLITILQKEKPEIDWQDYFFNCISYDFDAQKKQALNLFVDKMQKPL